MDRTFGKRHLHGETSPSSDTEYLASPAKQPKISTKAISPEVTVTVLSPGKASTSKDYLISPSKQSNISIERISSEITVTALQPEEGSTSEGSDSELDLVSETKKSDSGTSTTKESICKNAVEYLIKAAKQTFDSLKLTENEVKSSSSQTTSEENLDSPAKQPDVSIGRVPSEILVTALQPEEDSTSEGTDSELDLVSETQKSGSAPLTTKASICKNAIEYFDKAGKQTLDSLKLIENVVKSFSSQTTSKENIVSSVKQPDVSIDRVPSEILVTALQPEEDSTSEGTDSELYLVSETQKSGSAPLTTKASICKNAIEYVDKAGKQTLDSLNITKNEVEGCSSKNASTTMTGSISKMKDHAVAWGDVIETPKPTPENLSTDALDRVYIAQYASIYSTELIFAIDVVYLVRLLNGLQPIVICYGQVGEAPESPCDDAMDDALNILWKRTKNKNGPIIEDHIRNTGINYSRFQKMILLLAEVTEQKRYNTARLLKYCVTVAHWAVCAENNGVPEAVDFAPLVICRTFQNLKDAGKIPSKFWERMAQKAEYINSKGDEP